jgi:4-hydroxybenzoate polyprenyltransferase
MSDSQDIISNSKLRAYLELLRLPNVFTAMADVLMGFLLTHATMEPTSAAALLLAASSCLYLAGMVLNDVFDYDIDRVERPKRPLPSRRISLATARTFGYSLWAAGILFGWGAGAVLGEWTSGTIVSLLALAVMLYDRWLKHTPLGPIAMGSCRSLNVLLGMSAGRLPWSTAHWIVALGLGTYIAGVTWFARTEARRSSRPQLIAALLVICSGLALLALSPHWAAPLQFAPLGLDAIEVEGFRYAVGMGNSWYLLWILLGLSIGYRCVWAISHPVPVRVQMAIKHALTSLIVLDAAVAFAAHGLPAAVTILILLLPMTFIGRWIYST